MMVMGEGDCNPRYDTDEGDPQEGVKEQSKRITASKVMLGLCLRIKVRNKSCANVSD
jgi:hypothetical protein